jgi:peptidoglycan hydrolase-like protein with peptidoglycan-binding domain
MGSSGPDVRDLQKFLNARGFMIAGSGAGSSGNETEYFGSLTRLALARFQAAHGISPAAGYFGPITRMAIDLIMSTTR